MSQRPKLRFKSVPDPVFSNPSSPKQKPQMKSNLIARVNTIFMVKMN